MQNMNKLLNTLILPLPKIYIQGEKGTITAESWKTGTALARYVKNGKIVPEFL